MARRRNKKTHCLNCQYSFKESENYCPNCSQGNHDLKIPFSHFVEEFLEGIFHFDSKIWLSLKTLFIYPGKITKDFLEGKRVSFVPPIRLYVFFSFIFFLTLNIVFSHQDEEKTVTQILTDKIDSTDNSIKLEIDSLEQALKSDTAKKTIKEKESQKKLLDIMNLKGKDLNQLNQKIYKVLSFALFFLLPVFALIMKLIYYSSHKFYYEHLIAAIHYHVILFILSLLALGFYAFHLPSISYLILVLGAMIYFVNSLHTVYEQSWAKTIVKAFIIFWVYGILLFIVILFIAVIVGSKFFGLE